MIASTFHAMQLAQSPDCNASARESAQTRKTTVSKVHACPSSDEIPLGAGGWLLSEFITEPRNLETRFEDYDQDSAKKLAADITTQRKFELNLAKRNEYRDQTAFSMAYDETGWHIFVMCGEPDLQNILADGGDAGSLEMYFSWGYLGETYSQWIIKLPKGTVRPIEWNSPHRDFRPLKDYLKIETATHENRIGTSIFIPWEVLYNKLPLNGDTWPFGCIRWTPAGGITWSGKVHEVGRWGLIQWEKPTPKLASSIKKRILRKAWAGYQTKRDGHVRYWQDTIVGDIDFYCQALLPAMEKLDQFGSKMATPDKLSFDEIELLYQDAVADWMEFDYLVSALRRTYLENKLIR